MIIGAVTWFGYVIAAVMETLISSSNASIAKKGSNLNNRSIYIMKLLYTVFIFPFFGFGSDTVIL